MMKRRITNSLSLVSRELLLLAPALGQHGWRHWLSYRTGAREYNVISWSMCCTAAEDCGPKRVVAHSKLKKALTFSLVVGTVIVAKLSTVTLVVMRVYLHSTQHIRMRSGRRVVAPLIYTLPFRVTYDPLRAQIV